MNDRIEQALALLETVEKIEEIRADGFTVNHEEVFRPGERVYETKIRGIGSSVKERAIIVWAVEDSQHAATLSAIAAYERIEAIKSH